MKILLVNAHDEFSGAAIACKRLFLALLEQGYDCKLLVIKKKSEHKKIYSFSSRNDISDKLIRGIEQRLLNFRFYRQYQNKPEGHYLHTSPSSVYDIKKHELYEWADIINLHWVSGFLDFSSFFAQKNSKPIIWTLHDMNPFTGGCHHSENCVGFKTTCKICPQLSTKYQNHSYGNWQVKYQANLSNISIVTPSIWLKTQSLSSSLFQYLTHEVIPNCVDTTIFKIYDKSFCKSLFNIPEKNKTILFVAQTPDFPLKGMQYLLEILDCFDDNVSILVVGKYESPYIPKKITRLGTIYDERLMALIYNAADVFVLPSLAENLPNVIIESLCCGTPTVAFEIGGIPELIKNGINGFLLLKEQYQLLYNHIDKALNYDWDRNKISSEAHRQFNSFNIAHQYMTEFKKKQEKNITY